MDTTGIPETLLALAPMQLANYRSERYDGGGFSVHMDAFLPEEQAVVRRIYSIVEALAVRVRGGAAPDDPAIPETLAELGAPEFIGSVQRLGARRSSPSPHIILSDARSDVASGGTSDVASGGTSGVTSGQGSPDGADPGARARAEVLQRAIHDIRGGALTAMVGYGQLVRMGNPARDLLARAGTLAVDHAKLMRNAIIDIDPEVRAADERSRLHSLRDLILKWQRTELVAGGQRVAVTAATTFDGAITARCLETSAIDRILYNLMNNAARFAADRAVSLMAFPVSGQMVRFVVSNRLSDGDAQWIAEHTGGDLAKLFAGGLTNGGHGVGLTACVGFVGQAFGISQQLVLERGYMGAAVQDGVYHAWFHWPVVAGGGTEQPCDCSA